ncbi:MAG: hypothetical protein D6775_15555, partial [Caldilineae bacterium]
MAPLHVAIIWHMHQPYYRPPGSDEALLPWVRLHATKDYLHMAQAVEPYPDVHVTFTLVPSLAEQLQDYARGRLHDRLMKLARQSYFSPDDRRYLLNICFSIDWDNVIRRHPPYAALLDRRHLALLNPDYFSEQTYRDLIVWFNLAWTDPNLLERDEVLAGLVAKGRGFTMEDVEKLEVRHRQIIGDVLPTYRRLQEQGQIEIITVPYFHPILPLLVDSEIARRATPGLPLPEPPLRAPEDAQAQIDLAVAFHEQLLARPPQGMWPSEGAVSPEILPLVAGAGIHWLASDEAILGRSLRLYFERDDGGFVKRPDILYRPYRLATPRGDVAMVFRDHVLSDRVGFVYRHLNGEQAAEDMIVRLKHIQHQLRHGPTPPLVSIILDGENAWEYYEHNGDVFLHSLYRRLQEDPDLQAVTVSEHLQTYPPPTTLSELASGSWIRGDFTTWIGDPEHTEAWRRLRDAREVLLTWAEREGEDERWQVARKHLFAAEGSDWFWWYSRHNSSAQDALFDQAFIDHLSAVYQALGETPPPEDLLPIQGAQWRKPVPVQPISPRLTAEPDPAAQWASAQTLRPTATGGTMQQAGGVIRALRYGNDAHHLYLRLELEDAIAAHQVEIALAVEQEHYLLSLGKGHTSLFLYRLRNGDHHHLGAITARVSGKILEAAIPLARVGLAPVTAARNASLTVSIDPHGPSPERLPAEGSH